ncbi:MAG: polysaccharide biosynthesis tyrosine autokinase [Candidatus Scalindua sediminis]
MTRNPGLSNHLIGENDFESIIKSTCVPNLSIATCGVMPPNPSEMLGSTAMETFCKTVRERFDIVIFDSPPAMTVTDAIVLSRIMDGLIIVIKSGETVRETAKRAISQLTGNRCEILGAVVNYVDISRGSYYYQYYSHYYKYGYGSEEDVRETEKV